MTTHLQASADCNMQGYNQISGVQLVQQLPVINEKVSTILIFKKKNTQHSLSETLAHSVQIDFINYNTKSITDNIYCSFILIELPPMSNRVNEKRIQLKFIITDNLRRNF